MSVKISVIVPVFNEEENIYPLVERLTEVLGRIERSYEIILVDDGSTDRSREKVLELKKTHHELRLVTLRKNFGQTAALSAGFDEARGDILVTLDADLQNPPEDIPFLIAKLEEGYDLVNGWRKTRRDSWLRNAVSAAANNLISRVTGVKLRDSGCTLKAYRREIAKNLRLYGEMHRFIPALASWMGVSIVEIPVSHAPRTRGKSKYNFSRIFKVFLDLITVKFFVSYSTSPIQMFGRAGLWGAFLGFCFFAVAVILKITEHRTLTGNPLFYLFILMEMVAVQIILIGLLGEINIRTYHESQGKRTYVIRDIQ